MERENIYKGSTFNMKCQYCGAVLNLTDEDVFRIVAGRIGQGKPIKKIMTNIKSKVNNGGKINKRTAAVYSKSACAWSGYSGASCNVYWSGGVYAYTRLVFY